MSDEQKKSSTSSGKRRRRRRPSRKRKRPSQANRNDATSAPDAGTNTDSSQQSKRRRRRRRKSRSGGSDRQRQEVVVATDTLDAKLPESIFVYTHVLRSSELDTYGFRPDPLLNSSRSHADFRIDLSSLFPEETSDEGDEEQRIFDAALHGPILTSAAESMEDDIEDDFSEGEE